MKASVARRIDCQVKYKREFGQLSGRLQQRRRWRPRWRRHNDEMNPRRSEDERKDTESKPKFNLKSRILSLIELLQSNPSLKRGKGRPLPAQGNPLANLTTIKLNRNMKSRDFEPEVCAEYALYGCSRALQINLPWPNPWWMTDLDDQKLTMASWMLMVRDVLRKFAADL